MVFKEKIESNIIIDIRFNEIDLYEVVWNGHYLSYFELARQHLLEENDLDYEKLMKMDCLLPLIHSEVDFKKAIKYSDKQVLVVVSLLNNSVTKFIFQYEIYDVNRTQLFCIGQTHHVLVDSKWKLQVTHPKPLLESIRLMFAK